MDCGVLESYRTLGLICDDKSFKWHREGDINYISFPIGKSFLTYNHSTLKIRYTGCQFEKKVNSLDTYKDLVLLASGKIISAFHKVRLVKTYAGSNSSLFEIFVFGEYLLGINYSAELIVWDCESAELLKSVPLPAEGIHIIHPPTHLNKVLVSMKKGKIWLVNVKTGQKIYDFPGFASIINSEITALENAVALDTIGIGLENGKILMANILKDEVFMVLEQTTAVTSLSVCSQPGVEIMITGSTIGFVYVWNLPERKIQSKVKAHNGFKITKVFFSPNESLFTTSSGDDNSIKQWIFDFESPDPRLYKSREGFNESPKFLRFYNSYHVLACCSSSLRDFSILNEHQSTSLSSKHAKKSIKQQPNFRIQDFKKFAFSESREKDWTNLVSINENSAYLWNFEDKVIGHKIIERKNKAAIKTVAVSQCGNYGVLGFVDGTLEKFNMQSGFHQFVFKNKHNSEVVGLETDSLNLTAISASLSGEIFFWDFFTGKLKNSIFHNCQVLGIRIQKFSNLLGVFSQNEVFVYDIRSLKLARKFEADNVKEISFSYDSRWLAISDSTGIRIWDLPCVRLIDWVFFKNNVLSLDFSPDGNYLATVHENSLGVFLWLNKAYYSNVVINKNPAQPRKIKGFDVSKGKNFYSRKHVKVQNLVGKTLESQKEAIINLKMPKAPDHESFKVSELPYNRIMALYHLDEIKERNAPIQPPKKPEKVPFFLPDSLGIVSSDASEKLPETKKSLENNKENDLSNALNNSTQSILEFLKSTPPGRVELNLISLNDEEISKFVEFLIEALKLRRDYDYLQTVMSCFLKLHSDRLTKDQALALESIQTAVWEEIEKLFIFDISGLERLID